MWDELKFWFNFSSFTLLVFIFYLAPVTETVGKGGISFFFFKL